MGITVDDIMLAFTKTMKSAQIYGTNHPSFQNFYMPFYQKLTDFLKSFHELNFQVERFTLLHEDRVVYEDKEKDINIAFRLFRDGVRSVGFSDGLTSDELMRFLEVICQSTKEQDVALRLWESDFNHISFYVVEEEEEVIDYTMPNAQIEDIDYDAFVNEVIAKEKLDVDTPIIPDLSFDELNSLRTEIVKSEQQSIIPLAITTLTDFLNRDKSQEVITSLIELFEQCIDKRDFYNARRILHALKEYPDVNIVAKLENETTIMGFANMFNIPEDDIFNEFVEFVGLFSKKSIPYLLKMIASVGREDRLDALKQKIAHVAKGDGSLIIPFLQSEDVQTVMNAVDVLVLMNAKDTPSLIEPLSQHPDSKVRAAVILSLAQLTEPTRIVKFLDDPSSDIRIKTLQALTRINYPDIYPELLGRVTRKEFSNKEFSEQKEYFSCLIAHGDNNLLTTLKKILFKWILFGRKKYKNMRTLAAMSLSEIGSDEALEILRQGVKKRNRDIRLACKMALKET